MPSSPAMTRASAKVSLALPTLPAADTVGDLVAEACANAVVHGGATRVTVQLRVTDDDRAVELTVVDDGIGPRDGAPGLGSAYYAAASAGDWSLAAGEDGGAVLRVRVTG